MRVEKVNPISDPRHQRKFQKKRKPVAKGFRELLKQELEKRAKE